MQFIFVLCIVFIQFPDIKKSWSMVFYTAALSLFSGKIFRILFYIMAPLLIILWMDNTMLT